MAGLNQPGQPGRPPDSHDGAATAHIHIRTTKNRKRAYSSAAQGGGLTEWIFSQCDPAAAETLDRMISERESELNAHQQIANPETPKTKRLADEIQKLKEFRQALDKAKK